MTHVISVPVDALLRRKDVQQQTGLPRSTLYKMMRDGLFPEPVKIGARSVAWPASEVKAWIDSKVRQTYCNQEGL